MTCHYYLHMGDIAQTLDAFPGLADDAALDPVSSETRRPALVPGVHAAYIARSRGLVRKAPCSTNAGGARSRVGRCHHEDPRTAWLTAFEGARDDSLVQSNGATKSLSAARGSLGSEA